MNIPGIEFGRKISAAYAALCKPLCQKLHLPQTAFDILMFLANNPGYQTASDVVEVRKLKANLVSVNVDRLVQEGYLVREADPAPAGPQGPAPPPHPAALHRKSLPHH
jgi:DNA-binding MarR family transcriptional regulator